MKIFGISDVSVGYGSPEVSALMDSICRLYGATGTLIEPDEIARPPVKLEGELAFQLKRIATSFPDHTPSWYLQYLSEAMALVYRERPDVLIVFGASVFSGLLHLKRKPPVLVYHATEFISGLGEHDRRAHTLMLDQVDLLIAPDVERLILNPEMAGTRPKATAAIYNVADVSYPARVLTRPARARNGKFLYSGTLHRKFAFGNYFWAPELSGFKFEITGRITDPEPAEVLGHLMRAENVVYHGVMPAAALNELRSHAAFSLVWWNPEINPGFYYVPPNRFFTSIRALVPPIAAPHPQCETVIRRYGCGLLSKDWSLTCVRETLAQAAQMMNTPAYDRLVQGCMDAVEAEMTWEAQFARLEPSLKVAA